MRHFLYIFATLFCSIAIAQSNPSANMALPIPIPGVTPGPIWAQDINSSFLIIDQHNHSPGKGVLIQPNGININSDMTFQSHNATTLRAARFAPQSAPLGLAADIGELYVVGNELYYNDVTGGNQIAITSNGSVNAGAGSITGLPSGTAGVSYSGGTYTFQSATNTAANVDGESFVLRNSSASSKGLTLNPPAAMGSNFSLTLPSLPASQKIMTLDASGNMSAPYTVDGTTIAISANVIGVPTGGIDNTQLAASVRQYHKTLFDTSGTSTFTAAAGTSTSTIYKVTVVAGGGSGGMATGSTGGGGGGGGGAAICYLTGYAAAATAVVVVGAGAAGSAGAGNTGGTSSFGSSICAAGGGVGGNVNGSGLTGGQGGIGTFGDLKLGGNAGGNGGTVSGVANIGGNGGGSIFGGGGAGWNSVGGSSFAGRAYGGGGGGSGGGVTSGAGFKGMVLVEWIQ